MIWKRKRRLRRILWGILIIAVIVVVLDGLYEVGNFGDYTLKGNECIASSGYICATPRYNSTTGTVVITFGQQTGTTWTGINMIFSKSIVTQLKVLANGIAGAGISANTVAFCSTGSCVTT